jgi:ADP-heptose:LPS heptosyltransferase
MATQQDHLTKAVPTWLASLVRRLPEKVSNRLKAYYEPFWFVLSVVLPLWLATGRRPVLFSRYVALGDVICTFPAALELKKRHPGAAFIFHCREDYACLPRMANVTHRVVSRLNVRGLKIAYAFLFAGIYEFTYGDEFLHSVSTEPVIAEYCRQHKVAITEAHPRLQIPPAVLAKSRQLLGAAFPGGSDALIAIHPGPSGPFREWQNESWARLVEALKQAGFTNIVQLGSSRPEDVGKALHAKIPGVVSLVNQLNLEESLAVISRCDLLIGIDSGLLHAAAAVGTPFVGIFGATSPSLRFSRAVGCLSVVSGM